MQHCTNTIEKPQLIETGRGFSVFYRKKYLYSKYDPPRAIVQQIADLVIPPASLVVCLSPLLGYGLAELYEKLSADSYILALEYDSTLMQFSLQHLTEKAHVLIEQKKIGYIQHTHIAKILTDIEKLPLFPFKKCITLQCSGGVHLYPAFYAEVTKYADDFISRFWINRLTLIQLGRNYARNTFRNLTALCTNHSHYMLRGTEKIHKPVLVAGAGPSLDETRQFIHTYRKHFFLLAVDAAVPALLPEIIPDAAVVVESQYWIDSAFIGLHTTGLPLFADITASPRAVKALDSNKYFFCTEYASARYLQKMYGALQPLILPPLGSVGLTALALALQLTDAPVPVFHTGLDFSWGKGLSHARNSSPIKKLQAADSKLSPLYHTAYPPNTQHIGGKNNQQLLTLPNLMSYAEIYRHFFAKNARVIDIGTVGCCISDRLMTFSGAAALLHTLPVPDTEVPFDAALKNTEQGQKKAAADYLHEIKKELSAVNRHLCNRVPMPQNEFENALSSMDYLYLHFPDAARGYSLETSFLKRVRFEIERFLRLF